MRAFINFEDMSYDLTKSLEPVYNDVAFESYLRKILGIISYSVITDAYIKEYIKLIILKMHESKFALSNLNIEMYVMEIKKALD